MLLTRIKAASVGEVCGWR